MTTNDQSSNAPQREGSKDHQRKHNAEKLVAVDNGENQAQFAQSFGNGIHPVSSPSGSNGMIRANGAGNTLAHPASVSCLHDSSRGSANPLAVSPSPSAREALRVLADRITDPAQAYHPIVAVAAWCKLKYLHGQPISDQRLERLGVEVQTLDRSAIEQAEREQRIRTKAREKARRMGQFGPVPLILPDAIA